MLHFRRAFVCLWLVSPWLAPTAFAESAATNVPGISGASFVQGLLGLLFVIAILLVAAWLLKRMGAGSAFGNSSGMRIVGGLSIGPRERILLLEVGESWIVVGVTGSQMRTLHTMPKGELAADPRAASAPHFAAWLKQVRERKP